MKMRNKLADVLIKTGSIFVLIALGLCIYNQREAFKADRAVKELLPQMVAQIHENQAGWEKKHIGDRIEYLSDSCAMEMDTITVEGHSYIGYLTLPTLKVELPILSDWSQSKLKIAPCRYTGSVNSKGFVLMGHNYAKGFGQLRNLKIGDTISFQDVNGTKTTYQVIEIDVLAASAVDEMICEDYDLTLFTCTYGGKNRFTIRCEKTS